MTKSHMCIISAQYTDLLWAVWKHSSPSLCFPWGDLVPGGPEKTSDPGTRPQEERESQREQIVWRLKRLLGDAWDDAQITVETRPPSESICTEDFLGRFRDEMVDVTLLEDKLQQQNNTEETDQERHKEKRQNLLSVGGEGATTSGKSSTAKEDPQYCQKHHGVERDLVLLLNERAWAVTTPLFFLAVCRNTEAVMGNESLQPSSKTKTLAGNFEISQHLPAQWGQFTVVRCLFWFVCVFYRGTYAEFWLCVHWQWAGLRLHRASQAVYQQAVRWEPAENMFLSQMSYGSEGSGNETCWYCVTLSGWRSLLESDPVREDYLNQNHCDTISQDENEAQTMSGEAHNRKTLLWVTSNKRFVRKCHKCWFVLKKKCPNTALIVSWCIHHKILWGKRGNYTVQGS